MFLMKFSMEKNWIAAFFLSAIDATVFKQKWSLISYCTKYYRLPIYILQKRPKIWKLTIIKLEMNKLTGKRKYNLFFPSNYYVIRQCKPILKSVKQLATLFVLASLGFMKRSQKLFAFTNILFNGGLFSFSFCFKRLDLLG